VLPLFLGSNEITQSYRQAHALLALDKPKEAIKSLEPLLTRYPASYRLLYTLSTLEIKAEAYERALTHLQKAIYYQPHSLEAKMALLEVYIALGHYDAAEGLGTQLLNLKGEDITLYQHLSTLYKAQKRYEQGAILLLRALKHFPSNTHLLGQLGEFYALQGDSKTAEAIFSELSVVDPYNLFLNRRQIPPKSP